MVYFNCTSVFHTFIISYIMIKEFPDPETKACLIIPGHVRNLVDLVPKLKALPFIGNVIVVEESCLDLDENTMLNAIQFQRTDTVFVGGMERLGVWLFHKGKEYCDRVIIFEEGANLIHDVDKHIEFIGTLGSVKKGDLLSEDIRELWKLNGTIEQPYTEKRIRVHDLEMQKYLHDKEFMKRFLECMDILFEQGNRKLATIVFFDTYALAACKNCSRTIEKTILKKVIETIAQWEYEIKPHPNDLYEWKYEKDYCVSKNTSVPVEVLRLKQIGENLQGEIYIAYGVTGCIANELFLMGGAPYVIFLYKILRLYGVEYPGEPLLEQLHEKCSDIQKKKIFFPETFAELKAILYQITEKEILSEENLLNLKKKELEDTGRKVRSIYKNIFRNLPDELNETSIMYMDNHQWNILTSKKILADKQKYRIEFELPALWGAGESAEYGQCEEQTFRWYIARGAIVKVRLHSFLCFDQENNLVYEVNLEDMEWLNGENNESGWYIFNNCDPLTEFKVPQKNVETFQKIVVEAEIEWDLSYDAMLLLRNKNLEHMARTIESLVNDNEVREKTIQQLNGYLKEWEKEVQKRDEEIRSTIQQRDELNAVLVKEREQWQAVLSEKEKRIEELDAQCRGEGKGGLMRKVFGKLKENGDCYGKKKN